MTEFNRNRSRIARAALSDVVIIEDRGVPTLQLQRYLPSRNTLEHRLAAGEATPAKTSVQTLFPTINSAVDLESLLEESRNRLE